MIFFLLAWFARCEIRLEWLERWERRGFQNEMLLYKGFEAAIRRYELFGNHVGEISCDRVG
jgi:hypothetical protein